MINILPLLHNLSSGKNAAFLNRGFGKTGNENTSPSPIVSSLNINISGCRDRSRLWAGLALYCPSNYSWAALNYVKNTSSRRQKYDQGLWGCTEAPSMSFASAPFHREGRMDVEAGRKPPVDSSPYQRDSALGELLQLLGAAKVCRAGFLELQMSLATSSQGHELLLSLERI